MVVKQDSPHGTTPCPRGRRRLPNRAAVILWIPTVAMGVGHPPARSPEGDVFGGRLLHIDRDKSWGLVMRSHFFVGQDLPALAMTPDDVAAITPDELGPAVLQHAYYEFAFLLRFLPSLFVGANRDRLRVDLPW